MNADFDSQKVTTYFLEMTSPTELIENTDVKGLHVVEAIVKQYQFNRFLYAFVGAPWGWSDKVKWSTEQWRSYVEDENLRTWVAYYKGSPAGYFELHKQDDGNVEIAYFGLAQNFIGQGFGSYLLTQAIRSAWAWRGTERVWVHTCTLDHPAALRNYRSAGFRLYNEKLKSVHVSIDR